MKLIPITPEEQHRGQRDYICLDCFVDDGKEGSTKQVGIDGLPCQHALCGNHAKMIDPEVLDKE